MSLFESTVQQLIHVGNLTDNDNRLSPALEPLRRLREINCCGPDQWKEIALKINIADLIALNKGLARTEHGGSTASVIWTFRVVESRCPELADELADWILQRTKNRYLPYGSDNLGATSLQQYLTRKQIKDTNYSQHLEREQKSQELSTARRAKERQQRSRAATDRNTGHRQQFLNALSLKPLEEQLWQLAKDPKYPVTFYPTCLAGTPQAEIFALNIELRQALREKLRLKCRGPWAKFKRRLKNTFEQIGQIND